VNIAENPNFTPCFDVSRVFYSKPEGNTVQIKINNAVIADDNFPKQLPVEVGIIRIGIDSPPFPENVGIIPAYSV